MKKYNVIAGSVLLGVVLAFLFWLRRSTEIQEPLMKEEEKEVVQTQDSSTKQEEASPSKTVFVGTLEEYEAQKVAKLRAVEEEILAMLNTPLVFYGKVIDQKGNPVPYAEVGYRLLDKFGASGTVGETTADENGLIVISGVRGVEIAVGVSKEGYYFVEGQSRGDFSPQREDAYTKLLPTKEKPAVFILHKKGEPAALIHVEERQIEVPGNESPVRVNLITGETRQGELLLTMWGGAAEEQRFDWFYQLSIPGGGLIERKNAFDFEAPAEGYESTIEVKMFKNQDGWKPRVRKEYFAKLKNKKYARFSMEFYPGEPSFVLFESYLNPVTGNRNLEYEPSKRTK